MTFTMKPEDKELFEAIYRNDVIDIVIALDNGADIDSKNALGQTAHQAINNNGQTLQYLQTLLKEKSQTK